MKRKLEKCGNNDRWLLTYSDLITLLMIFFVVMYSISNINTGKYKQLAESLKTGSGAGQTIIGKDSNTPINQQTSVIDLNNAAEQQKMEAVKKQLDEYLAKNGLKATVTTNIDDRGLVVSIEDTDFFDTGKANIKSASLKKLVSIGRILNQVVNYMRVEGHTDNIPIKNAEFTSNWQLSAIRATNVTELLISAVGIPPAKISAVGYGEYRPIASNSNAVGRAKNRRVDIIIIDSKFNNLENNAK
jgi:chemotaxis protein MotB